MYLSLTEIDNLNSRDRCTFETHSWLPDTEGCMKNLGEHYRNEHSVGAKYLQRKELASDEATYRKIKYLM